jgi:glycosyltransferase involved in cell wall biosynthesis
MHIVILAPYPSFLSPSQRFRFEHYLPYLKQKDITYNYYSFTDLKTWQLIFKKGHSLKKITGTCLGFIKRFYQLIKIANCEFVYIHREAAPAGPPFFEFIIAKILRKKIIYDFDDAIWVKIASSANPAASYIKCTWKVKYICKWSYITTTGNDYLADFARKYCKSVVIIPTVVNTDDAHNKLKNQLDEPITIGWTGTFTNFYNLEHIFIPIKRLQAKYPCKFLIIADKNPGFEVLSYDFIKWDKTTEIEDLIKFNIGVMPLKNTEIELGKCGFKAIQYLSLGIPAVVSPVGVNCTVVENGTNGYWADNDEQWFTALEKLILNTDERIQMGKLARQKIQEHFSVKSTLPAFLNLFKKNDTE